MSGTRPRCFLPSFSCYSSHPNLIQSLESLNNPPNSIKHKRPAHADSLKTTSDLLCSHTSSFSFNPPSILISGDPTQPVCGGEGASDTFNPLSAQVTHIAERTDARFHLALWFTSTQTHTNAHESNCVTNLEVQVFPFPSFCTTWKSTQDGKRQACWGRVWW